MVPKHAHTGVFSIMVYADDWQSFLSCHDPIASGFQYI